MVLLLAIAAASVFVVAWTPVHDQGRSI